jgi:TolB protein
LILMGLALTIFVTACGREAEAFPSVYYLGWDSADRSQLFRWDGDAAALEQVSGLDPSREGDVSTFAVSPDGNTITYSLALDDGGSEIRQIDGRSGRDALLLSCPDAECGELAWSPDNLRLAYERRDRSGATAGGVRLWWLDTQTGETVPLLDADTPAYGAAFSPDGQRLAYVSPADEGVVVVDLLSGDQRLLPSQTGMPPRWSPDSTSVVFSNQELQVAHGEEGDDHDSHGHEYTTSRPLFLQNVTAEAPPVRLSPEGAIDDSGVAWSPDGQWLTWGRSVAGAATGRQVWIMRADGRNARALTSDAAWQHGSLSWSPDGRHVLYQRAPATGAATRPSIWLMDVATGEAEEIIPAGYLPRWGN